MKNVFDAHKDVDILYVVDGIPFLRQNHALNHAKGDNRKIKQVTRDSLKKTTKSKSEPDTLRVLKAKAKVLKIKNYSKMTPHELAKVVAEVEAKAIEEVQAAKDE